MAGPSSPNDDEEAAFAEAMRGVRPISKGGGRAIEAAEPGRPRSAPRRTAERAAAGCIVERSADAIAGRAPDLAAKSLRELRAGRRPIEGELDLHGRTRAEAIRALERFVGTTRARGRRIVLVVHGRGRGSEAGDPVLRPAVWAWLESPAAAALGVMAFATAPPPLGGAGATLVLLRRASSPSENG